MNNIIPFVGLLIVSAMLMLYIAQFSWKKRAISGAKPLTLLALSVSIWTLSYAFEIINPTQSSMMFWENFKLLGMSFASTFLLLFVVAYAGYEKWTERRIVLYLLALPTLFYVFFITNDWHQLIYYGVPTVDLTFLPTLVYEYGNLGWFQIGYGFFLACLSGVVLIHQYVHASKVYRQQILIIMLGLTIPLFGIVLALFDIIPFSFIDFSAFLLVISGIIMCIGVFRYGLLDLSPITHTAVLENIQDGVLVIDLRYRILEINRAATNFLDLKTTDVVGKTFVEAWPRWSTVEAECHQNGQVVVDVANDHGNSRYLKFRCRPIENAQQHPNGWLLIINDMTGHIVAEKLMAEKAASLADEVASQKTEMHIVQERSSTILRHVQDGIAMTGLDGKINYVNQAFVHLTGYEENELLGKDPNFLIDDQLFKSIKAAYIENRSWHGELIFQRKDGRSYVADVMFSPVHDENGRLVGFVSSHRDISKQKDLEKARTQFINSVSHELRTPVTNLKLYGELMKLNLPAEKQANYQEIMVKQVERLEKLIEDILELSALDLGTTLFDYVEVDVQDLLETAVANKQMQAEQKAIHLMFVPQRQQQKVWADFDQLEKAVANLIDNAIIFTPEHGTVSITCSLSEEREQHWVQISVADEGPGIAPEEQAHIFRRFYRGNLAASGKIPGTGVGLSSAKQIVQLQGGDLTVASEMGVGSVFTIKLPAEVEPIV